MVSYASGKVVDSPLVHRDIIRVDGFGYSVSMMADKPNQYRDLLIPLEMGMSKSGSHVYLPYGEPTNLEGLSKSIQLLNLRSK